MPGPLTGACPKYVFSPNHGLQDTVDVVVHVHIFAVVQVSTSSLCIWSTGPLLWNPRQCRRVILSIGTGEKLPTWCRPTYVDDSEGLEAYFGSTRIVKGHDVQIEGANCNVAMGGTPRLRARNGLFAANEMCRIDVGMSRCFNMYRGRHVPFTVLRLYEADGEIRRDILEERVFLGKDNTF